MTSNKVGILGSVTSEYMWVIENFRTQGKNIGDIVISPEFSTCFAGIPIQWHLGLFPKGENDLCKNCLGIYLFILTDVHITLNISFAIHDSKGQVLHEKILNEVSYSCKNLSWGFSTFACDYFVMHILDDDKLRIVCRISACPIKIKKIEQKKKEYGDENSETDRQRRENRVRLLEFDTFERMIRKEDKFCDVTFKIGNQTRKAHKCILANRSPVFATMFEAGIEDNALDFKNVDPEVFTEFLRFVYSGKVNDIKNIADELLILAEKYKLDTLFQMCEETLCKGVNIDSVMEKLKFAEKNKTLKLKKTAVNFIVKNAKDVVVLPSFKVLKDTPDLLLDIVYSMAMHDNK